VALSKDEFALGRLFVSLFDLLDKLPYFLGIAHLNLHLFLSGPELGGHFPGEVGIAECGCFFHGFTFDEWQLNELQDSIAWETGFQQQCFWHRATILLKTNGYEQPDCQCLAHYPVCSVSRRRKLSFLSPVVSMGYKEILSHFMDII
jgi:hypothetical protein